ncbi:MULTISPECIES: DUF4058 family protein [unclassified Moorena]|uniref:DUF4058 family protein n=1 Tax=unclassified Moorena TaxID=2683338 RepID=UPI0013CB31ED|nr:MULTISPECIES: DUF4058 family protein [unclassified Moorena]NEO18111.1 DUF4058 family protein [Moorena sp. SIO4A5]NEQ57539.1 DUF4058 family protein [Moorena sp. SIO4A1]
MPSPFPGMNPYLEDSAYWSSVHHWLITEIARLLNQQLAPKYVVAVEVRIYETSGEKSTLIGIPDNVIAKSSENTIRYPESNVAVAVPSTEPLTIELALTETIKQGYLEVRRVGTGKVVTAIEIISPINKNVGEGRKKYENKRQLILNSKTNFVEIDLLRQGNSLINLNQNIERDYHILVSPSHQRPQAYLYAFNLQDVIPVFPLPLCPEDPEMLLDLQMILHQVYDQGRYDLMIDYKQKNIPGLSKADTIWVEKILKNKDEVNKTLN